MSRTWNVKLADAELLAAGSKLSLVRSATAISVPADTGVPLYFNVPVAGSVVIFTAARALAGESVVSVSAKSVALKV